MSEYIIDADGLTKKFGDLVAVDDISFKIKKGQVFGFVGPNGSGKSTTIRMLCGIVDPTAGTAKVLDYDIREDPEKIKQKIGYMSQKFGLYQDLTVYENIEFYAGIYQIPAAEFDERIESALDHAGLNDRRNELTANLGVGYRQRLALACSIIHDPELIFLDEPTAGVDPVTRGQFWSMLYEMAEAGRTSFVTTHYMEEAERCSLLGFIHTGRLVAYGSPAEVKGDSESLEQAFLLIARKGL